MIDGMKIESNKRIPLTVLRTLVKRQGFNAYKFVAQTIRVVSRGKAPFIAYTGASRALSIALHPAVGAALFTYDVYKSLSLEQKEQLMRCIDGLVTKSRVKYSKTRKGGRE